MPSPTNCAVIAAAGSRKTQGIIEAALAAPRDRRVLITTYTRENCDEIIRRIHRAHGCMPPTVKVTPWFTFLINQAARPYQSTITGRIDYARSLNFKGQHPWGVPRARPLRYYFDRNADFYRNGVSEFAVHADRATGGLVIQRLEALYDEIYIDELQDLAGYDFEFLDLLFASDILVTVVGDPRQHTYSTNQSRKNTRYRGHAMVEWLEQRSDVCPIEYRNDSWRCNQEICDWADGIYPDLPKTTSRNHERTGHDGVFLVVREDVLDYVEKYRPVTVLRWDRGCNTMGLPALNIGLSKGSTYPRVLIFPTKPMVQYLKSRNPTPLRAPEHLYVAVTRAQYSVAFVVDRKDANYTV
jgi:DNA helicase II / ATP-dependent DNA helicase PcrA